MFELADGGTLFLDEIGGLPPTAQAKLLRVLELGEVSRVGALDPRRVDVHVIAATNRDLRAEVAAGRFRGDLFYRLNVVEVKLPPLRDRREDIPYLTAAFVREIGERLQKPLQGLTPGAEARLTESTWDGNVRELRNVVERACILADGEFVTERELAVCLPPPGVTAAAPTALAAVTTPDKPSDRSAGQRRTGSHPARAGADRRQQEGRGADARPQPTRALSPARAARAFGDDLPPTAVGDARGVTWLNCALLLDEPELPRSPLPAAEAKRSVLIVDDEPGVRHLMRRWLESRGYVVAVAAGADKALELLSAAPTAVALCDLRMPGHDGLWLADQLRREHPDTAVIIATGLNDVSAAIESLRQGVVEYLTKPFERDRLCEAVSRAVEWHRTACDSRRWREQLEDEVHARDGRMSRTSSPRSSSIRDDDLDVLLATLTATNPDAYAHAYRVAALSVAVARALDVPQPDVTTLERAALMHDLGKLAMPDAVLRKPAPLTVEEQRLIRLHPRIGSELIEHVPYLGLAAAVVRDAHERVDGLGYPSGKRQDELSLSARIVAVADAYDTMTRARVFRDAMTPAAALAELERCSGTQFDPQIVSAFTSVVDRD